MVDVGIFCMVLLGGHFLMCFCRLFQSIFLRLQTNCDRKTTHPLTRKDASWVMLTNVLVDKPLTLESVGRDEWMTGMDGRYGMSWFILFVLVMDVCQMWQMKSDARWQLNGTLWQHSLPLHCCWIPLLSSCFHGGAKYVENQKATCRLRSDLCLFFRLRTEIINFSQPKTI